MLQPSLATLLRSRPLVFQRKRRGFPLMSVRLRSLEAPLAFQLRVPSSPLTLFCSLIQLRSLPPRTRRSPMFFLPWVALKQRMFTLILHC